jgi:predicted DNA-binding protein (MmcQ/YjbR family)
MHKDHLQEFASQRAAELPGVDLTHPFGENWDVFKVRGKVFMLHTELAGEPLVIVKSAPADASALRNTHSDITAGYHMNKQHWITLHPGGDLEEKHMKEIVTESYLLVVEGLSRQEQPVDPHAFAQRIVG